MVSALKRLVIQVQTWQDEGLLLKGLLWFWVVAFIFVIVTSVLGIESYYNQRLDRSDPILYIIRESVIAVCYFISAVWFVINYSGRGMPLLAAYALLCFGFTESNFSDAYVVHGISPDFLKPPFFFLRTISNIVFVYFILLFPNGKFVPKWSKYYAGLWALLVIGFLLFPDLPYNFMYAEKFWSNRDNYVALMLFYIFPTCLQVYRYFFVATSAERQQSKWIVIGLCAAIMGAFFDYGWRINGIKDTFSSVGVDGVRRPVWIDVYVRHALQGIGYSIFPFTLLHALSKNNFWRTDPLVRRSITYSSLTLITLLIYGSIVAVLNVIFEQRLSFFVSLIAASVIAVLFHPLKQGLQQRINQRLYGQRDDPYKVLAGLSEQAIGKQDALATLQKITESTANVLKLPFVAIDLDAARRNPIASFGSAVHADVISLALTHELEHLGTLRLARRAEGETFTSNEKMLLTTIAQQVSVIAHNYKLTQDLQASREQLVISREEERRRIRRDLHDGLGPTLASTALQLETVQNLIYSKPDESVLVLKTLEEKMTSTLAEVRSLVHDLYPTAIDQLGLQEALRTELNSFEHDHLSIVFDVTGSLENLPAATEVASYRIIMEAIHNVVKHAKATNAKVRMNSQPAELNIHICDNGVGLAAPTPDGLGLKSICERAEELGGKVEFVDTQQGGTCILVALPARADG